MPKQQADMPFFRILTSAFQYALEKGHPQITPFEVLISLINDPEAAKFFEESPLDFEALCASVAEMKAFYEELVGEQMQDVEIPEGKRVIPIYLPQTVGVCAAARDMAMKSGHPGYAEILDFIARSGDEHVFESITNAGIRIQEIHELVENQGKIKTQFNEKTVDEVEQLKNLEAFLKSRVFDQDEAVEALVKSIKRAKAGLKEPDKPVGSFLFTGPTGSGKTELAIQTAEGLGYDFLRFDMSEYSEKHNVARMIGAPPGYIGYDKGGELTQKVAQNPKCVILLDEIEKAHPDVFNALLQIMDAGRMTDGQGNTIDFSQAIIIMTSNAGAHRERRQAFGFAASNPQNIEDQERADYDKAIKMLFSPEFRNRLDGVITFKRLSQETVKLVAEKFLSDMNEYMLAPKGVDLVVTPSALDQLAGQGFDDEMGARPMKRTISEVIKNYLADEMLFGSLKDGGTVVVDYNSETQDYTFEVRPLPEKGSHLLPPAPKPAEPLPEVA